VPLTHARRVTVRRRGLEPESCPVRGPGRHLVGASAVEVALSGTPGRLDWEVANAGHAPCELDAVAFTWDLGPAGDAPRVFCHGYQSWSPTRTRRLGVDHDPSRHPRSHALVRAAYAADPGAAAPAELRSEQVTLVRGAGTELRCIGFDGGEHHAGTLRLRVVDGRIEVTAEAWLGGARLDAGTARTLHALEVRSGDDPSTLLGDWAAQVGARMRARTRAPFQVGWCSWYHYFAGVDERAVRANLARSAEWPFEVFQVDDGFQAAIGDWLVTAETFPSGVDGVAAAIAAAGRTPGLWLAPFLAAPDSEVARTHPDWLARAPGDDRPAIGMFHETWGGVMWQLDTTHPEVQAHLARLARDLVDAGYRYLKLDFTFSAAMPARVHDPYATPAERVRAGYDAVRAGAGDETFIVGCGCPLGPVVGAVDGMRIGPDVAPSWETPPGTATLPGYEGAAPATRHALVNTMTRAFQHRRLWSNDPDCLMLRTTETALTAEENELWTRAVALSGGSAFVSDDLALLDDTARRRFAAAIALGRSCDADAASGRGPHCDEFLNATGTLTMSCGPRELAVDPARPRGVLDPGGSLSEVWWIRQ